MTKKKQAKPEIIPMKCAVCTSCYRTPDMFPDRCIYGGPYKGYSYYAKDAPVV
jgi:hypothetical protein